MAFETPDAIDQFVSHLGDLADQLEDRITAGTSSGAMSADDPVTAQLIQALEQIRDNAGAGLADEANGVIACVPTDQDDLITLVDQASAQIKAIAKLESLIPIVTGVAMLAVALVQGAPAIEAAIVGLRKSTP